MDGQRPRFSAHVRSYTHVVVLPDEYDLGQPSAGTASSSIAGPAVFADRASPQSESSQSSAAGFGVSEA